VDYFNAVQEGRARVRKAIAVLDSLLAPSSPVLFLKMDTKDWTPVGEETMVALVKGQDQKSAIVICDADGNSKAISAWVTDTVAQETLKSLEGKGLGKFEGELRLPI
jgi:hypothetical protein